MAKFSIPPLTGAALLPRLWLNVRHFCSREVHFQQHHSELSTSSYRGREGTFCLGKWTMFKLMPEVISSHQCGVKELGWCTEASWCASMTTARKETRHEWDRNSVAALYSSGAFTKVWLHFCSPQGGPSQQRFTPAFYSLLRASLLWLSSFCMVNYQIS